MITAIFNPGDKSITTEKLLQWDYGQVLSIKGLDLPKAVEIHFCVYTDSTTITAVGITTDDHTDVEIPDGLLQQERELRAYVYVADMEQGKTVRTVNIPIQGRQKPEIPHTPEDTEIFREAIKAVNNSADRAETAANTSEQNAKKTAEDRMAIEEMVETVSGIEQQVQDVKKYAGQAETAASNAALSEQEAKKSENAALQAKADAETAKGSAETAAGKTAEDKTAVERAKEEVLQAKQQVSADRAEVEAVERKVAQMGNAIPRAVLEGVQAVKNAGAAEKQGIVQAGSEQKSAVESTGTKAVEDIVLAKKTATDAVETAKTGAVGAVGTAGAEQTRNVTAEGEKQVKAVQDKGAEVLQSIPEDFTVQMQNKLDKQQGVENAGKAMVINPEGLIVPGEVTGGDGIPIINTASGGSPLVVSDSAERVNKGLSIIGNTVQNQDPPPSPDNPQEIKNVGKWNPETQKYEVGVKVVGKNILNIKSKELLFTYCILQEDGSVKSNITNNYFCHINIIDPKILDSIKNGQTITFSIDEGIPGKALTILIVDENGNKEKSSSAGESSVTMTVSGINKVKKLELRFNRSSSIFTDKETIIKDLMLCFGESTQYQPYSEQTLTLTSDRPITKWDKLVEQDGQIGWLYQSCKKEFDGTEVFDERFIPSVLYNLNKKEYIKNAVLCNYADSNGIGRGNTVGSTLSFKKITDYWKCENAQQFKVFLKAKKDVGVPLCVLWETVETEFVPLSQSEQDAIRALATYYPTTVITVDGGEVDPDIEVTYIADTKNYIDQKIADIGKTVVETQKALL